MAEFLTVCLFDNAFVSSLEPRFQPESARERHSMFTNIRPVNFVSHECERESQETL